MYRPDEEYPQVLSIRVFGEVSCAGGVGDRPDEEYPQVLSIRVLGEGIFRIKYPRT